MGITSCIIILYFLFEAICTASIQVKYCIQKGIIYCTINEKRRSNFLKKLNNQYVYWISHSHIISNNKYPLFADAENFEYIKCESA